MSGIPPAARPALARAPATVERAAVRADWEVGAPAPDIAQAIEAACQAIEVRWAMIRITTRRLTRSQ